MRTSLLLTKRPELTTSQKVPTSLNIQNKSERISVTSRPLTTAIRLLFSGLPTLNVSAKFKPVSTTLLKMFLRLLKIPNPKSPPPLSTLLLPSQKVAATLMVLLKTLSFPVLLNQLNKRMSSLLVMISSLVKPRLKLPQLISQSVLVLSLNPLFLTITQVTMTVRTYLPKDNSSPRNSPRNLVLMTLPVPTRFYIPKPTRLITKSLLSTFLTLVIPRRLWTNT